MHNKVYTHVMGIDEAGCSRGERAAPRPIQKFIIGIDEAGRGPFAGPVVVAGVKTKKRNLKIFENIRDSKKLSVKKRDAWFRLLTTHPGIEWAVARVWPRTIDRINIAEATNLGARRVYKKLSEQHAAYALLDGSLYLAGGIPQRTIIRGDEQVPVIAAASIIAKVTRDRIMLRLHKKYPEYRFDMHKGYGTKLHRQLLQQFGVSDVHRKSFRFRNSVS